MLDMPIQSTSKYEASTSSIDTDIKHLSQPTPTQKLKELIKTFDEMEKSVEGELNRDGENSNFSDGFDDALFEACDKLELSLNEQNEEITDKATSENSVKVGEPSGFDFSVLDSPPRQTITQEKRKIEETQPKTSGSNNKKMKLPPWLVWQRIA